MCADALGAACVGDYARRPAIAIPPDLPVAEAAALFERESVTGAPVVAADGRALGVLSVTDLIALALFGPALALGRSGPDEDGRQIPDVATFGAVRAQDLMTPAVWSATPGEPLRVAAERLIQARVHRLVVLARDRKVEGVLSTLDLMRAVRDARASAPIGQFASRSVASVEMGTPVASVMRQLLEGGFTGMPVTDTGWPIGFISQSELLAARHLPMTTPVEEIASPSFLCLPEPTAIGKAAEEGLRQGIRRLLLVRSRQVTGIFTSVDFARAVAQGC